MAYCGFEWVSDYCFTKVMDYRTGGTDPTLSDSAGPIGSAAGVQDCLLVWGTVVAGEVKLRPGFVVSTVPTRPDPDATYHAELLGADGQSLAKVAFEPDIADHSPNRGFVVAVPIPQASGPAKAGAHAPGILRVARNGVLMATAHRAPAAVAGAAAPGAASAVRLDPSRVRFTWDARAHPGAMIRNELGQVIALAEGGSIDLVTAARALTVQYSDAVSATTATVPVE